MTKFHIQEANSSPQRNGLVHKSTPKNVPNGKSHAKNGQKSKSHSKTATANKPSSLANGHEPKLKKNGFSYQDPFSGKIWKKVLYEQVTNIYPVLDLEHLRLDVGSFPDRTHVHVAKLPIGPYRYQSSEEWHIAIGAFFGLVCKCVSVYFFVCVFVCVKCVSLYINRRR
jgi:hypothetical protein